MIHAMTSSETLSLRERQAAGVREDLRSAFVRLIVEKGVNGFSLHDVAEAAGVSDRTLYRYYPSREALVAGVRENENEQMERRLRDLRGNLADLSDTESFATAFEVFEEHGDLIRAAALLRQAGVGDDSSQQRTDEIRSVITANADVGEAALGQLLGLIRTLSSSDGWMRMTGEDIGLDSREAGYAVHWAMQVLLAAARDETGPLRPRAETRDATAGH
jgi:AcrR family transcriptional regulator